jgi:Protein of unknown function (DUF3574)
MTFFRPYRHEPRATQASPLRAPPWMRVCRAAVVIGWLGVDACVHHAPPARLAPRCLADVLYFGRNIAGGGRPDSAFVSSAEWHAFADTAFRRWLPNGSTETGAEGRYVADGRWVAESTKVVTVVHVAAPVLDAGIDSAVALYRRWFKQETVGRVRSRVRSNLCES